MAGDILILLNAFTPGNRAGESARNASLGLVPTISGEGQAGKIGRLAGHRPLSPEIGAGFNRELRIGSKKVNRELFQQEY